MEGMNKVILIGRLGRDPEDRMTSAGKSVANLSLATNQFRAGNGATEKFTEWHRIVAFGKTADQCKQYLRKGRLICVEGSLRTRSWEKPPGERHYTTEVVAARVDFLDSQGGSPPPEAGGADAVDPTDDGF
jgi:single-strand DNA-binding protein